MAERMRKMIEALTISHEDLKLKVTASIGCSSRTELEDASPTDLIGLADKRLYKAKETGRNRVVHVG